MTFTGILRITKNKAIAVADSICLDDDGAKDWSEKMYNLENELVVLDSGDQSDTYRIRTDIERWYNTISDEEEYTLKGHVDGIREIFKDAYLDAAEEKVLFKYNTNWEEWKMGRIAPNTMYIIKEKLEKFCDEDYDPSLILAGYDEALEEVLIYGIEPPAKVEMHECYCTKGKNTEEADKKIAANTPPNKRYNMREEDGIYLMLDVMLDVQKTNAHVGGPKPPYVAIMEKDKINVLDEKTVEKILEVIESRRRSEESEDEKIIPKRKVLSDIKKILDKKEEEKSSGGATA
ncbi:MAG: hypothetical protein ACE5J7_04845 [Candidatus Aenigmatarchaeota archaeon]